MARTTKLGDLLVNLRSDPLFWAEDAKTDFTEEIVRLMEEQGVSKKELALRLGTSQSYVTKVLNENVNFTIESMSKIAFALDGKAEILIIPTNAEKAQDPSRTVIYDTLRHDACFEKDECIGKWETFSERKGETNTSNIISFPGLKKNWDDCDIGTGGQAI